jgi:hypothetical protein
VPALALSVLRALRVLWLAVLHAAIVQWVLMHLAKVLFNALPVQLAAILAKKEPPVASCVVLELTASLPVFRVVYLVLLEVIQAFQVYFLQFATVLIVTTYCKKLLYIYIC